MVYYQHIGAIHRQDRLVGLIQADRTVSDVRTLDLPRVHDQPGPREWYSLNTCSTEKSPLVWLVWAVCCS